MTSSTSISLRRADTAMGSDLVVYVDTVMLDGAFGLAMEAARRGIDTALVCRPGQNPAPALFARVVETDDFGLESLRGIVADLEQTWRVRGITSSFGPFRAEGFVHGAVASLAAERGLAHSPIEALVRATNKYLARDAIGAAGVHVGGFDMADDAEGAVAGARKIGLPVIMKPVTGVGSSLILRCDTEAQVAARFTEAMRLLPNGHYPQVRMAPHAARRADQTLMQFDPSRSLLMEEYFPGREASVECLVIDDQVIPLLVHDKVLIDEGERVVYEHVLVAPPERFSAAEADELVDYAVASVRALGLRWCFCHVELRYVDGVGPRLLELNPRIGAGCVADSIQTFWGFDVTAMYLDLVMGQAKAPPRLPRSTERHAMAFLFSPRSGVLRQFAGLDRVRKMPEVEVVRTAYRSGDAVGGDLEEIFLASIWMRAATAEAAVETYRRAADLVEIEVG